MKARLPCARSRRRGCWSAPQDPGSGSKSVAWPEPSSSLASVWGPVRLPPARTGHGRRALQESGLGWLDKADGSCPAPGASRWQVGSLGHLPGADSAWWTVGTKPREGRRWVLSLGLVGGSLPRAWPGAQVSRAWEGAAGSVSPGEGPAPGRQGLARREPGPGSLGRRLERDPFSRPTPRGQRGRPGPAPSWRPVGLPSRCYLLTPCLQSAGLYCKCS